MLILFFKTCVIKKRIDCSILKLTHLLYKKEHLEESYIVEAVSFLLNNVFLCLEIKLTMQSVFCKMLMTFKLFHT